MTKNQLFVLVEGQLREIQHNSGRGVNQVLGTVKPIGDLDGFDSPSGLEFTCGLEEKLRVQFDNHENLCVQDLANGFRVARTVDQIVDRILELHPKLSGE